MYFYAICMLDGDGGIVWFSLAWLSLPRHGMAGLSVSACTYERLRGFKG